MATTQSSMQSEGTLNRIPIMIVLISGAFVAILNQTLLATALPHIMRDLHLEASTAQWLTSVFMLVNGIMIPITAFLIGRFTTRALFLTAMGLFATGTLICAVAPNFSLLMVGRIVQASGAGIIMPLMQTILMLIYPKEKRGEAMGMFGLVISFAPAIGPTLSGWLVEQFPWRSLFYIVLPIIIIDLIMAYFILKNVTKQTFPKVDILSIILSSLGFGGVLYGFSIAGSIGWTSEQVMISLGVGLLTLVWFILRQLKLKQPILEFRLFKIKLFTITTAVGMVIFLGLIGSATVLPLLMQDMLGFTAFESGLMLLPGAIVMAILSPITGRLFDKFGARWLSIIGILIVTVTTFLFAILSTKTTFTYLTIMNALRMLGISMVMMPVTTAGLNVLPKHLIAHGTAMNNTMRQVAGAVGVALLVSIMTNSSIPDGTTSGLVQGVNVSFMVAGIISIVGLSLTFFIKDREKKEEGLNGLYDEG